MRKDFVGTAYTTMKNLAVLVSMLIFCGIMRNVIRKTASYTR